MAIINSIFVGKPRNSAGNVVAYVRQGVPCVRSKPTPNKAYQPSVAQRQQQSVFKFLKRNIDAINFMFVIDSLWDAKPKKGKGQSKSNMFYQSWLPHLIAKRSEIAMLPDEKLVSPALFFGDRGVNLDTCTNGLLGTISSPVGESIEGGFAFDFEPAVIASLLDKANRMRPSTIPQLTTANIKMSIFGMRGDSEPTYKADLFIGEYSNLVGEKQRFSFAGMPSAEYGPAQTNCCFGVLTIGSNDSIPMGGNAGWYVNSDSFLVPHIQYVP